MEIKVELNIPADFEIELSSTFLVELSRQFGVEHSYTEFLELSNCSHTGHVTQAWDLHFLIEEVVLDNFSLHVQYTCRYCQSQNPGSI